MRILGFKKLKTLTAVILLVLSLLVLPSCEITPANETQSEDNFKTIVEGVYQSDIITANFLVEHTGYQTSIFGGRLNEGTSKGSAVIYAVDEPKGNSEYYTYYLLSNNHVVYESPVYTNFECTVTDCYGDEYVAKVVCKDPDYDLSILYFQSKKIYAVLDFALVDPVVGDTVISMGSPMGVLNAVTVGKVTNYELVEFGDSVSSEISNVAFNTVKHDCLVNNGSSGGVLLNEKYEICGINFAAEQDKEGKCVAGYAVQISKVIEFINMQN